MKSWWTLLLLPLLTGCLNAGIVPKAADLTPRGKVGAGASMTIFTLAPATVDLAGGETDQGYVGSRGQLHPMAYMGYMALHAFNTEGFLRWGVAEGAELTFALGMQQAGWDLRLAVLDEDKGRPLSLGWELGMRFRPFQPMTAPWTDNDNLPWLQTGMQISRRYRRFVPFVNLHLSFGPEAHAFLVSSEHSAECGGFGEEGCGEYGPPRQYFISQREMRLHGALGFSAYLKKHYYIEKGTMKPMDYGKVKPFGTHFTLALVPYIALARWDPTHEECVGCSYLDFDSFTSHWGLSLTFSVAWMPFG